MRYSDHNYRHGIGWTICHMEWVTKYRYKIFSDSKLKNLCEILLHECAKKYKFRIDELEIQPEHVHVLVMLRPSMSAAKAMSLMKGYTSRLFFLLEEEKLAEWYNQSPGDRSLWGDGKFFGSVGHITLEKAKEYMEKQEAHHAKSFNRNPHHLWLGGMSNFERWRINGGVI